MIHSIANDYFQVKVQQTGAELCSLVSQKTGEEFIWEGDENVWGSYAPVLFPIIGALKNGQTLHNGKVYSMPKHGIVRNNEQVSLKSRTNDRLTFQLTSNEELKKAYPFDFDFQISFQLVGNQLVVAHKVVNLGDETMYFSLGGHPAFKCPVNKEFRYEDYYIEFEKNESLSSLELSEEGLVKDSKKSVLHKGEELPLTKQMFEDDALIFTGIKSKRVKLINKKNFQQLTMTYSDFDNLALWAKPGGRFICIEPWLGLSDSVDADGLLENKKGILSLDSCDHFLAQYTIEIEE